MMLIHKNKNWILYMCPARVGLKVTRRHKVALSVLSYGHITYSKPAESLKAYWGTHSLLLWKNESSPNEQGFDVLSHFNRKFLVLTTTKYNNHLDSSAICRNLRLIGIRKRCASILPSSWYMLSKYPFLIFLSKRFNKMVTRMLMTYHKLEPSADFWKMNYSSVSLIFELSIFTQS